MKWLPMTDASGRRLPEGRFLIKAGVSILGAAFAEPQSLSREKLFDKSQELWYTCSQ